MWITWGRVGLTPITIILLAFRTPQMDLYAALCFMIASASDYFDGYLARRFQSVSVMGKFMDPIADKILVSAILIALIPDGRIDPYMVIILLSRDTLINGVRSLAASHQLVIDAKPTGKWKTATQMVCLPAVMIGRPIGSIPLYEIGYYGLWLSVVLSVISATEYIYGYVRGRNAATPKT